MNDTAIQESTPVMNDTTTIQESIATTQEFKAALLATRDWMGISPTQLQMLQAQCRAPDCTITATQIATQLGLKSPAAARLEYAAFARAVADKLGYAPPRVGKRPVRWWYQPRAHRGARRRWRPSTARWVGPWVLLPFEVRFSEKRPPRCRRHFPGEL